MAELLVLENKDLLHNHILPKLNLKYKKMFLLLNKKISSLTSQHLNNGSYTLELSEDSQELLKKENIKKIKVDTLTDIDCNFYNCKSLTTIISYTSSLDIEKFTSVNITSLELWNYNDTDPLNLPKTTKKLILNYGCTAPMNLPENLTYLKIRSKYRYQLNLPSSLTYLNTGEHYIIPNKLPENLITFKTKNKLIHDLIVNENLKYLKFKGIANNGAIIIPNNSKLKVLELPEGYDYPLNIPETIHRLRMIHLDYSNDQLSEMFKNVKSIKIDGFINNKTINLPNTTRKISIGAQGENNVLNKLPDDLVYLKIYGDIIFKNIEVLPKNIHTINMKYYKFNFPIKLPDSLKKLYLSDDFNQSIELNENLEKLEFGDDFNQPIKLNKNLKTIKFGIMFYRKIELNENLRKLHFGKRFNLPITLNEDLRELKFGDDFCYSIILPKYLRKLKFGSDFNEEIILNENLEKVKFGRRFNQPINLPNRLRKIKLGRNFNQPLNNIPENLKTLIVGKNFHRNLILPDKLKILKLGSKYGNYINIPRKLIFLKCGKNFISRNMENIKESWLECIKFTGKNYYNVFRKLVKGQCPLRCVLIFTSDRNNCDAQLEKINKKIDLVFLCNKIKKGMSFDINYENDEMSFDNYFEIDRKFCDNYWFDKISKKDYFNSNKHSKINLFDLI